MLVQMLPDTITKLIQVSDETTYEPAGDQSQQERRLASYQSQSLAECITNVATPKGAKPILKTMIDFTTAVTDYHAFSMNGFCVSLKKAFVI